MTNNKRLALLLWKDTSTFWVSLKDLKYSNPVDVADYVVANKLFSEPEFKWWVPYTIKKRERIVANIKTRYLRREQKIWHHNSKELKRSSTN
jgi:hypothetical protein